MDPAKLTEQERTALLDSIQVKPDPLVKDAVIADPWSDKEKADFVAKGWRTYRAGERPKVTNTVRPTDYDNDLKRGTVNYDPRHGNYSFMTVVIPQGTVVEGKNFAQAVPNTVAILSDGPITLRNCNLCNVALDPSWDVEGSLTAQAWIVPDEDGSDTREFICAHPDELKGNEVEPVNVIKARGY